MTQVTIHTKVDKYLVTLSTHSQVIEDAFRFDFPGCDNTTLSSKILNITTTLGYVTDDFIQKEDSRSGSAITFKNKNKILYEYLSSNKDQRIQCIYDKDSEIAHFYGLNEELIYEKIYLFVMSRIGEFQEQDNILRIHGFAVDINNRVIIGLAPSGGGKSTLCASLIESGKIKLYSEDVVLIDEQCNLKTNKHRLSFIDNLNNAQDQKQTRIFKRSNRPDKILLRADAIKETWATESKTPTDIVSLKFTREKNSSFEKLTKFALFKLLVRDLVIGYGLPQIVEFFLVNGFISIIQKIPLVFRRLILAIKLTQKCQGTVFYQSITQVNNSHDFLKYFT